MILTEKFKKFKSLQKCRSVKNLALDNFTDERNLAEGQRMSEVKNNSPVVECGSAGRELKWFHSLSYGSEWEWSINAGSAMHRMSKKSAWATTVFGCKRRNLHHRLACLYRVSYVQAPQQHLLEPRRHFASVRIADMHTRKIRMDNAKCARASPSVRPSVDSRGYANVVGTYARHRAAHHDDRLNWRLHLHLIAFTPVVIGEKMQRNWRESRKRKENDNLDIDRSNIKRYQKSLLCTDIRYWDGSALSPGRFRRVAARSHPPTRRRCLHKASFARSVVPDPYPVPKNTDHTYFEYDPPLSLWREVSTSAKARVVLRSLLSDLLVSCVRLSFRWWKYPPFVYMVGKSEKFFSQITTLRWSSTRTGLPSRKKRV